MNENTQIILNSLDFNQIMVKLLTPNPSDKVFADHVVFSTVTLIALSTGLPLKDLIQLKWSVIFEYSNRGKAKCLGEFKMLRNYEFPINKKIENQLIYNYNILNQPSFDACIKDSLKSPRTFDKWMLSTNIELGLRRIDELDNDVWSNYRNKNLTQILFGRRVFETCGYSNKTSKFLKGLFKIKTIDELFQFLGYSSKGDIDYKLSKISLIEGLNEKHKIAEPSSFLNDNKHFYNNIGDSNDYYPFQHFQQFYDFLLSIKPNKFDTKTHGVLILLMLSLTNGIRPSALLNLKWPDVFIPDKNGIYDSYVINNTLKLGKYTLQIDEKTRAKILIHYKLLLGEDGLSVKREERRLTFLKIIPLPKGSCFVTNTMNPITQPSLSREIKNALTKAGFQHAEKFTTKSPLIMFGRRIIELKGMHSLSIKALKSHFNIRNTVDLFDFLFIDEYKGDEGFEIKGYSVFDHILYDI